MIADEAARLYRHIDANCRDAVLDAVEIACAMHDSLTGYAEGVYDGAAPLAMRRFRGARKLIAENRSFFQRVQDCGYPVTAEDAKGQLADCVATRRATELLLIDLAGRTDDGPAHTEICAKVREAYAALERQFAEACACVAILAELAPLAAEPAPTAH